MQRSGIGLIVAILTATLACSACFFNGDAGEKDPGNTESSQDSGTNSGEQTGNSKDTQGTVAASDAYDDTSSWKDSNTQSDSQNGSTRDVSGSDSGSDGDNYDGTSSTPDFITRHDQNGCLGRTENVHARIQVGPADDAFTQLTGATTDEGHTKIPQGGWVKWVWKSGSGSHTVTGDKSETFTDDDVEKLESACGEEDTAWFDSNVKGATEQEQTEMFCVKFNKVGEYYYQCAVGQHCENGMWGRVDVVKEQ